MHRHATEKTSIMLGSISAGAGARILEFGKLKNMGIFMLVQGDSANIKILKILYIYIYI